MNDRDIGSWANQQQQGTQQHGQQRQQNREATRATTTATMRRIIHHAKKHVLSLARQVLMTEHWVARENEKCVIRNCLEHNFYVSTTRLLCLSYLIISLALAAIYFVPRVGERRLNILSELFDVFLEISVVLRRRGWRT